MLMRNTKWLGHCFALIFFIVDVEQPYLDNGQQAVSYLVA